MRLQKYLATCGVASRRKCEAYILDGLVSVNGEIVTTLGTCVEEGDEVRFNGEVITLEKHYVYYMLNKPTGCVTTVQDEQGRMTVLDIMEDVEERIFPVGRLDLNTSGLLILTNDGELTYGLTHPKHDVNKTYEVKVRGKVSEESVKRLEVGVVIDGRRTYPAKVKIMAQTEKTTRLAITIHEGRNRQVRKMCEAIGHQVVSLNRRSVGDLNLGNLKLGEYRKLTAKEVNYLKKIAGANR
nr:pseudouridine synthase [uncultured Cellulosilyticum sp.]